MKTLTESLFDTDLVAQDLSAEKAVMKLNKDSLKGMLVDDVMGAINSIIDCGEKYSMIDVKSHPVDLSKNVLICIRKHLKTFSAKEEPCKYAFCLNVDKNGKGEKMYIAAPVEYIVGGYYWSTWAGHHFNPTKWRSFIRSIDTYYDGCDFVILPTSISKGLIEIIKKVNT